MGLTEDIDGLKKKVNDMEVEKTKTKKFRLPWKSKVNKKKAKKNWITIMKINENGYCDFKRVKIDDQTFMEDGIPRLASAPYILRYKKNPLVILPSWSVKPFSPAEQYEKSMEDGSNIKGYKILMAAMIKATVGDKKGIGGWVKWVIGLGLLGLIIYAIVTGGGF